MVNEQPGNAPDSLGGLLRQALTDIGNTIEDGGRAVLGLPIRDSRIQVKQPGGAGEISVVIIDGHNQEYQQVLRQRWGEVEELQSRAGTGDREAAKRFFEKRALWAFGGAIGGKGEIEEADQIYQDYLSWVAANPNVSDRVFFSIYSSPHSLNPSEGQAGLDLEHSQIVPILFPRNSGVTLGEVEELAMKFRKYVDDRNI